MCFAIPRPAAAPPLSTSSPPFPQGPSPLLDPAVLNRLYGERHRQCPIPNPDLHVVLSCEREIDLFELETLCDAVGWSRRPLRRVRKALQHSLLRVGLWRHDARLPRLVGFARCTGDGVVEATVWDVAVHPLYQGVGLGRALMDYVLAELRAMEVERVSLFADPDVVGFYEAQGWELEPLERRCAFWYSP
jgi:ribosomal protein S18 acetylase RimI-like enzyme